MESGVIGNEGGEVGQELKQLSERDITKVASNIYIQPFCDSIRSSHRSSCAFAVPLPSVSFALETAPKTFLEKRSYLRGILALSRVIEWNVLTFYLLAVVAFANRLVWGWVYSLQVASGVFWFMNSLHLFWAILEVSMIVN